MHSSDLLTMIGWAAGGTGFTFMMTALGAASVFSSEKPSLKISTVWLWAWLQAL